MKKSTVWMLTAFVFVVSGVLLYCQPQLTMFRILLGARSGDELALRDAIDFPGVRDHLKARFAQKMMQDVSAQSDINPFAALGVLLAQKMSDTMIDSLVTPEMLSTSLSRAAQLKDIENPTDLQLLGRIFTRIPGHYVTASTYVVEFGAADVKTPLRFVFQRDLVRFRLTQIDFDLEGVEKAHARKPKTADSLAKARTTPAPQSRPVVTWEFLTTQSPIDDKVTAMLRRAADGEIYTGYGSVRPVLLMRCVPGMGIDLFVDTKQSLDYDYSSLTTKIRVRFDQRAPEELRWAVSTDREAIFAPNPEALLSRFLASHKLLVEFRPARHGPSVATFTLDGLELKLEQLRSACGLQATKAAGPPNQKLSSNKRTIVDEPAAPIETGKAGVPSRSEAAQMEIFRSRREADEARRKAQESARVIQRKLVDEWRARIQAKIWGRVIVPPELEGNPEARFDVVLLPGGEVLNASLRKSSGSPAYDAAVERAILASQPLPVPNDTDLFQENFRELTLVFRPHEFEAATPPNTATTSAKVQE